MKKNYVLNSLSEKMGKVHPWKIKTENRKFFRFTYDNKKYCYSKFDFNDKKGEEEDIEYFEEIFEDGSFKKLVKVELLPEVTEKVQNGTIPSKLKVHPCVPDSEEKYSEYFFSNGVRNVLADVFGFFDFYHAEDVEDKDKIGWIGVIRRNKKDVWAIDQTGVYKRYDNDYVSHFYTKEDGNGIVHSTGKKGLFYEDKYNKLKPMTKYYLRIDLPASRK